MAKKYEPSTIGLSGETKVEVVKSKDGIEVARVIMTVEAWNSFKKTKGFIYTAFQVGFCS